MAKERKISILLLLRDRLTKPITAGGRALRTFRNNARLLGQTLGPLTGRIAGLAAAFAGIQTIRKSLQLARVQVQAQAQLGSALRGNIKLFDQIIDRAAEFQTQTTIGDEEFIKQAATLAISLRETGFEMARLGDVTATTFQVAAATGRTATRVMRQLIETITLGRVSEEITKFFPQLAELDEEALRAGAAFDLLSESLAGTAEALAATDFGRVTQQGNLMGDLFERLGTVFVEIQADIMPRLVASFEELVETIETDRFKGLLKTFGDLAAVLVDLLPTLAKIGAAFVAIKTAAFTFSVIAAGFAVVGGVFALVASGGLAAVAAIVAIGATLTLLILNIDDVKAGFSGMFDLIGDASLTLPEKIGLITDELAITLLAPLRLGQAFVAMGKVIIQVFKNLIAEGNKFATELGSAVATGIVDALLDVAESFDNFTGGLADAISLLNKGAGELLRTDLVKNLQLAKKAAVVLATAAQAAATSTKADLDKASTELALSIDRLSKESRRQDAAQLRQKRLREIGQRQESEADTKRARDKATADVKREKLLRREADLTEQLGQIQIDANASAQKRITAQTLAALQDRHRRGLVLGSALVAERIKVELEPLERSIELAESKAGTIRRIMDSFAQGDAQRVDALQRLVVAERELQKLQLDRVDVLRNLETARRSAAEGSVAQVRAAAADLAGEQKRLEAAAGLGGISIAEAAQTQAAAVARFQEQVSQARAEVSLLLGDPQYATDAERLLAVLNQIETDGLNQLQATAVATGEGISQAISGVASPALGTFFKGVVQGTADAREAFEGFLNSLLNAISNFIAASVVQDFLTLLTGTGQGGLLFGAQGLLPGAGGGLLGAGAAAPAGVTALDAGAESANTVALTALTAALGGQTVATAASTTATTANTGIVGVFGGLFKGLQSILGGVITASATLLTTLGTLVIELIINSAELVINTIALGIKTATGFFGLAGGGLVPGPRVHADVVPARLTPGEWVLRQQAASYYGRGILEAMNRQIIPRELFRQFRSNVVMAAPVSMFQAGGSVQPTATPAGGLMPAVVVADDGTMERLLAGGENALMRFFEDHAPRISALLSRHRGLPI